MKGKACVIGSGPNGLSAAIVLAKAGLEVTVVEAERIPGGATRSLELTLPGFLHDFGSAVHPLAAGSPFFLSLPLDKHGLSWVHSPAPLAHPLDDGTAVVLEQDLGDAEASLGVDGKAWRRLMQPFARRWSEFANDVLRPPLAIPRHPTLMMRFGAKAILSAKTLVFRHFQQSRARSLFAGLAAHSLLSLEEPLSAGFGMLMAVSAHVVGWPIPRGGSQAISNALSSHFFHVGGHLVTSKRVEQLATLSHYDLILCDLTPLQLLKIAGDRLSDGYKRRLAQFRYGPGVFKVDYALNSPIPWRAPECLRAATIHLGGSWEEIAASEQAVQKWTGTRRSLCHSRPAELVRSRPCAERKTHCLGLLPCAEWIQV